MTTFKDVLCLLAIFVIYGIAGRLDYEDAVGLEQTRQSRQNADCLASTPADRKALARINDQRIDPPSNDTDAGLPEDGQSCPPRAL
ncbi:MAG: hypothetical protein BGO63_01040 [Candidatus Accumulibacter sp. 66-26]|nr:hypothetical protein [Accumulibacter sp.]OJW50072.1 MAG: hypothetical protein BGO63_01040 [Candidatus Accumulibacter sp. 66-26]